MLVYTIDICFSTLYWRFTYITKAIQRHILVPCVVMQLCCYQVSKAQPTFCDITILNLYIHLFTLYSQLLYFHSRFYKVLSPLHSN